MNFDDSPKSEYPPWNHHSTWKMMVGILVSFWDGLFSGAMLVSGSVKLDLAGLSQPTIMRVSKVRWCQLLEHLADVYIHKNYNDILIPAMEEHEKGKIPDLKLGDRVYHLDKFGPYKCFIQLLFCLSYWEKSS